MSKTVELIVFGVFSQIGVPFHCSALQHCGAAIMATEWYKEESTPVLYVVTCQRGGVSNEPPWLQAATHLWVSGAEESIFLLNPNRTMHKWICSETNLVQTWLSSIVKVLFKWGGKHSLFKRDFDYRTQPGQHLFYFLTSTLLRGPLNRHLVHFNFFLSEYRDSMSGKGKQDLFQFISAYPSSESLLVNCVLQ